MPPRTGKGMTRENGLAAVILVALEEADRLGPATLPQMAEHVSEAVQRWVFKEFDAQRPTRPLTAKPMEKFLTELGLLP